MRILNITTHAALDYILSLLLIASPWIFGFAVTDRVTDTGGQVNGPETWVPVTIGIIGILYSLATNYRYSIAKILTMRVHLAMDVIMGLVLTMSPWIFGFSERIYLPHVLMGVIILSVVLITDPATSRYTGENKHPPVRGSASTHTV